MKKLAMITAAGALAAFMTTGSAVANHVIDEPPTEEFHDECVSNFNAENTPVSEEGETGEQRSAFARERNADRKAHCEGLPEPS